MLYVEVTKYDLIVIGGGSGGLACAKAASDLGAKVACLDFVQPSPQGSVWGLGGTCVNVGCIPKKLMHQASILKEGIHDSAGFGWNTKDLKLEHDWHELVQNVQGYIKSLNFGYRSQLMQKGIDYINAIGNIISPNRVVAIDRKGNKKELEAKYIVLALGGRPKLPDNLSEKAKSLCITSDDIFMLKKNPGKTLVVGASYVALECAGFLKSLGYDVTLMARSIFLRGFDQQCAELIVKYMRNQGHKFIRCAIPIDVEEVEENGVKRLKVTWESDVADVKVKSEVFDTVLFATGRSPAVYEDTLPKNMVEGSTHQSGKLLTNEFEQVKNYNNIFAIGDVNYGKPELTPVAILVGKTVAQNLFGASNQEQNIEKWDKVDYKNIPTTVFTPLEYGCIGYSEEEAIETFGKDNLEIYHTHLQPLEWAVPHREDNACYAKLICNIKDNERIVGFHILAPNAGEITQGYAVAMRLGATKKDFDNTVGIHPTISEIFTTLTITKKSGKTPVRSGC